jgi:hypothetical protein
MISDETMTSLFMTLDLHDVPLTYLAHAIVTDFEGKEHTLTPLEFSAFLTRERPLLFKSVQRELDGKKMRRALQHELNRLFWPLGWAK